jgi:hypothetical protein
MKQFAFSILLIVIVFTASACGAPAVPTVNAADVQHTAEAAAFTMVAQTQAAVPTATPLPPTEPPTQTPPPTDTPVSLPTLETLLPTVTAGNTTGNATVDPCSTRVLSAPKGRETVIRIVNETKEPITVSMYLNETAGQGECGYRTYNLGKLADVVISDLVQGCYNLWAFTTDAAKNKFNSSGYGCINNPDKWTFEVSSGSIKFVGP